MLAQARRRMAQRDRGLRHLDRARYETHRLAFARAFHQHLVVQRLRVDQRLAQVAHRGAEQVLRFQAGQRSTEAEVDALAEGDVLAQRGPEMASFFG